MTKLANVLRNQLLVSPSSGNPLKRGLRMLMKQHPLLNALKTKTIIVAPSEVNGIIINVLVLISLPVNVIIGFRFGNVNSWVKLAVSYIPDDQLD